MTATLALFLSLGGASYAAVHLAKSSVGTAQLKNGAVSTAKTRNGAVTSPKLADNSVTSAKIADGAVTGAKVNAGTLGTVPAAVHAAEADKAANAAQAAEAGVADLAEEAEFLSGFRATSFGPILTATTKIPATTTDAEWWIPVNGAGQPSHEEHDVQMLLPGPVKLSIGQFAAFAWVGPDSEDAAVVSVQLEDFGEPVGPALSISRLSTYSWTPSSQELPPQLVGELAIHVREEANGEEIPAIPLQTALRLVPIK